MTGFELDLAVQVPNALGFVGTFAAGRRRRWGWALGFSSEIAWAAWALADHAYGILPWCAIWGAVYGWNWWLWKPSVLERFIARSASPEAPT